MKLLILSSNNGGGHNAVAEAIAEYYIKNGWEVTILDCLSFISKDVSSMMSSFHTLVYRHFPQAHSLLNTNKDKHARFREGRVVRKMIDGGKKALGTYLLQESYDQIICTHIFGSIMLFDAMRDCGLTTPSGFVETDYLIVQGSVINTDALLFIPHESLMQEVLDEGIAREKIVVSGIPVKEHIVRTFNKDAARKVLGISREHPHILLMGGSMGCGPIAELVELLVEHYQDRVELSVVCGTNQKLCSDLHARYQNYKSIHIFGYMPDMSYLYGSADLLVTKPGGITTTEAAVSGLPMVLINVVGGGEEINMNFFVDQGCALTGNDEQELAQACIALLEDESKRTEMAKKINGLVKHNSAEIIYHAMSQFK